MLPALAFLQAGDAIERFKELIDTIRMLYDDVADADISRIPTSVDIAGMHQDALSFLLLTFGTGSTELMMN